MAMAPEPILEVEKLLVSPIKPGSVPERWEVSCSVLRGEFLVIEGATGSGKTKFVEQITGLSVPSQGTIRLFGKDTMQIQGDDWTDLRKRIGVVFGDGGRLFSKLSALENIALPLRYHLDLAESEISERITHLMQMFGIENTANLLPGTLSRSLRIRVALARALIMKPEVLILDNPVAGLDPLQTDWWLDTLSKVHQSTVGSNQQSVTVVVTSADAKPWMGKMSRVQKLPEQN